MGNSDLHRPLRSCQLLGRGSEWCHLVNVFVVSDGHWTDTASMMSSARLHSNSTRIFTLGVGSVQARQVAAEGIPVLACLSMCPCQW